MDEFKSILKESGGKLVVVDFTATWCGPCQRIGPIFEALSKKPENSNVVFLKVDVDDASEVAQECKVNSMPTFQFYKNGEKIEEFSGADGPKLEKLVDTYRN
ncbi:thioredoxin-like isoform X2 [Notolabrus celidotus]|uniref:thioredoxin-like isoform X2 n=1 Tax=Notolabrus celidotus TaxID=1203425 RepID=UPI00148FAAF1|nr:thioredoxin-like isoform X2 [Notolabrus celidotus]